MSDVAVQRFVQGAVQHLLLLLAFVSELLARGDPVLTLLHVPLSAECWALRGLAKGKALIGGRIPPLLKSA